MGSFIVMIIVWIIMWKTALGRYTMFNPWVNSYTSIVFNILFVILMRGDISENAAIPIIVKVFWIGAIIDRIWDIREVSSFDEALNYSEYNLIYRIKVMVSFHTLGLGRAVFLLWRVLFLLIIAPLILTISVRTDVKMIRKNGIMPQDVQTWYKYRHLFAEQYFRERYWTKLSTLIERKMKRGSILSNAQIVDEILFEQNKRFKEKYLAQRRKASIPEKIVGKAAEIFNEEIKEAKNAAELEKNHIKSLIDVPSSIYYAYIDARFYNRCKDDISQVLLGHSTLSPSDIIPLAGLEKLAVFHKGAFYADRGEYFVLYYMLYVLKKLDQEGLVMEDSINDNILDPYQYTHRQGKPRKCINADNDPRLDLGDD